ncbi:DUF2169 domain-containing protein [Chondromyces apiculatus]|uniref:DUF2169 domain-containing protein n=1 Tax=Chondromyces apiculatus DSM 436 TaxID=1192034 RepID=A0A017TFW2_9BACT|nr:DUF2169 domain-containing protein [Chondromyces apiculatus]EYF08104.1 Hypothetical protein CAP_5864 [Chondromyces apiculatus DSM 436]
MEVVSLSPLPVGSVVWQPRPGAWTFSFVCKATFRLLPGRAQIAEEHEPLYPVDRHWSDDPGWSLYAPADVAPVRPRADVVVVGEAFAPPGKPARSLIARLRVADVDKRVEVCGERLLGPDGSVVEGARFTRMPLLWERAAGGPDTVNPVGVRPSAKDAYGRRSLPNLLPPGLALMGLEEIIEPVGFGPVAASWPERRKKLGRAASTWSDRDWSRQPLPQGMDVGYFNAAPWDQQADRLRDDERIVLEHLHPEHQHLATQLPGHHPRAFLARPGRPVQPLAMQIDLLWIRTDTGVCSVTWRGQVPLDRADEEGRVVVGLEEPGQSLSWEEITGRAIAVEATFDDEDISPASDDGDETLFLSQEAVQLQQTSAHPALGGKGAPNAGLPFAPAAGKSSPPRPNEGAPRLSGTPFKPRETAPPHLAGTPFTPKVDAAPRLSGTPFTPKVEVAPRVAGTPFAPAASAPPSPPTGVPSPRGTGAAGMVPPPAMAVPVAGAAVSAQVPPAVIPAPVAPPPVVPAPAVVSAPVAPPPVIPPPAVVSAPGIVPPPAAVAPPPVIPQAAPSTTAAFSAPSGSSPPGPVTSAQMRPQVARTIGETAVGGPAPMAGGDGTGGTGGALSASNAAAAASAPWSLPKDAGPAGMPAVAGGVGQVAVEAREVLQLLWFDPESAPRFRRQPSWQGILAELEKKPLDKEHEDPGLAREPAEIEDRREAFEILVRASATDAEGMEEALGGAVRSDGKLIPPLRTLAGELIFPFDETEALKVTVAAVTPFVGSDETLRAAVTTAQDFLKVPDLRSAPAVAEGLMARVVEAWNGGKRPTPQGYLEAQTERALLEGRCYQRRKVLGGKQLRALAQTAGAQMLLPVYLPDALADGLPLYQRFRVRAIVEVHPQVDQYEVQPLCLKVLALARVARPPRRG